MNKESLLGFLVLLTLSGCNSSNPEPEIVLPVEVALERPINETCLAHDEPVLSTDVKFENIYPQLDLGIVPIQIYRMPGNETEWFMIDRKGFVSKFKDEPNVTDRDVLLDITEKVDSSIGELGLLGMAFHPQFETNNKVYLYYSYLDEINERYTTLSEYTYNFDNDTLIDEISIVKLRQYSRHHQGGNIIFGPDGYLYFGYGDDDRPQTAQELDDLYGKIIRIKVVGNGTYTIPDDNPFVNVEGARAEIYALGFRHPWRFSIDPESNEFWLGDVGASNLEEVDKIVKGGNYGWPIKEGTNCLLAEGCEDQEDLIDPVLEYSHEAGWGAIIGGVVYRGSLNKGLVGQYIFADFSYYSQIISLEYDSEGQAFGSSLFEGRLNTKGGIHSFTSDNDGEIYITHWKGIFKMLPDENIASTANTFPQLLSETGCFSSSTEGLKVVESAVSYDVASSLYSDGATKKRWMAIPDETEIQVLDNGDFIYPLGSVLIKEFSLENKKIETRLLMKNDTDKWAGYTYLWNDEQTEAELLPAGKTVYTADIEYQVPNRVQCQSCHNNSINGAIGPEYRQLNFEHTYSDTVTKNQIEYLSAIGFIKESLLEKKDELPALPDYHLSNFSNEERVQSFAHSNCSHCHNPSGPARGSLDFTWQVKEQWGACDKDPEVSSLGIEDARLIAPGNHEKSIIYRRLNTTELYKMPPLGRSTIQHDVTDLFENYIAEIECK